MVRFRVTAKDRARLQTSADAANVSVSEFIRMACAPRGTVRLASRKRLSPKQQAHIDEEKFYAIARAEAADDPQLESLP